MASQKIDAAPQRFAPGSLVKARHRDWIVLPQEPGDPPVERLIRLRPLAGAEHERIALVPGLEPVEPAHFPMPAIETQLGNFQAARLLREATRLATRAAAGPFLSLARIGVEPRPYQFVPLMLALQQDPVRLLLADDVGVGKTIEACLIARELWDRGDVKSIAVLCPPALADQWRQALVEMFHMDATLVLASSAQRLEREAGEGIFRRHPITVVSLDYIKSDRRRDIFLRDCPDLVLVDEAHTCSDTGAGNSQKRYQLLKQLVSATHQGHKRHLVLITATPHTGNQDAFRSLLTLLNPTLQQLPAQLLEPPTDKNPQPRLDTAHEAGELTRWRDQLAAHFVQRRRSDIVKFMRQDEGTRSPFPSRRVAEAGLGISPQQRSFLAHVLDVCRAATQRAEGSKRELHLRYWSALALLRAVSSSPQAALTTLATRAGFEDIAQLDELDEAAHNAIEDVEDGQEQDAAPGISSALGVDQQTLLQLAREARALIDPIPARNDKGKLVAPYTIQHDLKLAGAVREVRALLRAGRSPILFCRFIPTVGYVANAMRASLDADFKDLQVVEVTGDLSHEDRRDRVKDILTDRPRVLVCTDCLSEGINLQHHFNAVIHYDLAWTPTRHEQREGRVDRYEQPSPLVHLLTLHVLENPVDRYVLTVLQKRRDTIRRTIGVQIGEDATFAEIKQSLIELFEVEKSLEEKLKSNKKKDDSDTIDFLAARTAALTEKEWSDPTKQEADKVLSQSALQGHVEAELPELLRILRRSMGAPQDALNFLRAALPALGVTCVDRGDAASFDITTAPALIRDLLRQQGWSDPFLVSANFQEGAHRIVRTHPLVAQAASYVLEAALDAEHDPSLPNPARRCAVVRTLGVSTATTLLIVRARYRVTFINAAGEPHDHIVDDITPLCFEGRLDPSRPVVIRSGEEAERLLTLEPHGNVDEDRARRALEPMFEWQNRAHMDAAVSTWIQTSRCAELLNQYKRILNIKVRTVETATARQLARDVQLTPMPQFDHIAITIFQPAA